MKKLILILLTICIGYVVQGQTKRVFEYKEKVDECGKITVVYDTFDLLLVDALYDYQQYCYNDSVELAYFNMSLVGDMVLYKEDYYDVKKDFPDSVSDIIKTEIEHKTPTFAGFIEWLKKKE